MPGAVVIDSPEKRRANPIRFVLLTATDQRDGGYRIVIEVGGAMQRPRFDGRIAGQDNGPDGGALSIRPARYPHADVFGAVEACSGAEAIMIAKVATTEV